MGDLQTSEAGDRVSNGIRPAQHRWPFVLALLVLTFGVLFSLWPVLMAPIAADDRYWSIETPAKFDGSYLEAVIGTWHDTPVFLKARGALAPVARLARRVLGLAIFDVAHLTSTPLVTIHGIAKFLLIVAGVASCLALLKVLRWRTADDRLIGAGRATVTIVGSGLLALLAVGAQAHSQFRNGWISYPVLTYGAIIIVFGSAALLVFAARRVADRRGGAVALGLTIPVVLAVLLAWGYELNYFAVPLSLFALLVFPLTPRHRSDDQRRGRLLVGGAFAATWVALFTFSRILISNVCGIEGCADRTTISLGPEVLRTLWYNFVSSFPGSSSAQFLADLNSIGASSRWTDATPGLLWVISVALGISLWVAWRWASARWPRGAAERGAERKLLMFLGAGSIAVAVGSALIMSLSVQAHEIIHSIGLPYRHTVLTWTAAALALILIVRAIELSTNRVAALVTVTTLALVIVSASTFTLPRNLVSTQAYRTTPAHRALSDVHWEVVAGDLYEDGDERRCDSFDRAEAAISNSWLLYRLEPAADQVFRQIYNRPYCSTWSPP